MAGIRQFEAYCIAQNKKDALAVLKEFRTTVKPNRKPRPATSQFVSQAIRANIFHLNNSTDLSQHEIATRLGVNQGRVNEVLQGLR